MLPSGQQTSADPSPRAPSIGIYCDLGAGVGTGHFVRSVALGAELARSGAGVTIAAAIADGEWSSQLARDHGIATVECRAATDLAKLAARRKWDGLILDSYLITADDCAEVDVPIVAIDDLALRPLPAQLVINPNLTGHVLSYRDWPAATVLRGPGYAQLRPELVTRRPATYRERGWSERRQRVLVMCGGTDPYGAAEPLTQRVLATLSPAEVHVLATGAPLRDIAVPDGSTVTIGTPTPAVAPLIDWADLVVTTAGTTVWEMCCLGAPMALVVVAENQREHCRAAVDAGIAVELGTLPELVASPRLPHARILRSPAELNRIGRRAWHTVDGRGTQRAAQAVLPLVRQITVRPATGADSAEILAWRNDPRTRIASANTAEVSPSDHRAWLANVLSDTTRQLLIAEHHGEPVAVLRFDRTIDGQDDKPLEWEISINLAPSRRGGGLAAAVIGAGHTWLRQQHSHGSVLAFTRVDNLAMLATFHRCGYRETSRDDDWVTLGYDL